MVELLGDLWVGFAGFVILMAGWLIRVLTGYV